MSPTLIITNDFPPTIGGIEGFVYDICRLLDDDVIVLTRRTSGWADHDRQLGFSVVRQGNLLLPTPAVARTAAELITAHRVDTVIFGAMAPLALLAPAVRRAGASRLLAITHGHETWWASLPGSRQLVRRMAAGVDLVSTVSAYTASRIGPALAAVDRPKMIMLPPPVDHDRFRPADDHGGDDHPAAEVGAARAADRPVRCLAVGRMVRQKGFDTLLRAWPRVLQRLDRPAELVLVGDGPQAGALHRLADRLGIAARVRFAGSLSRDQVAVELRRATVFALPVRTRFGGLNPEGLGMVFLEAAASGLPVIVGRSGGAPETVRDRVSGYVVDPDDIDALAVRITELLTDTERSRAMGRAGRAYVIRRFGRRVVGERLRSALERPEGGDRLG